MSQIKISRQIPQPPDRIWAALADLESHSRWMKDAEQVVITSEESRGVGTTMEVETRVGPFRTNDVMEVVGWEEHSYIEVVHKGLIEGHGRLEVGSEGDGRDGTVTWSETLWFPWWLGGRVVAFVASPVLRSIWRGNLKRLEELIATSGPDGD